MWIFLLPFIIAIVVEPEPCPSTGFEAPSIYDITLEKVELNTDRIVAGETLSANVTVSLNSGTLTHVYVTVIAYSLEGHAQGSPFDFNLCQEGLSCPIQSPSRFTIPISQVIPLEMFLGVPSLSQSLIPRITATDGFSVIFCKQIPPITVLKP